MHVMVRLRAPNSWLAIGSFACQHFRFGARFYTPTNAPLEAQELYTRPNHPLDRGTMPKTESQLCKMPTARQWSMMLPTDPGMDSLSALASSRSRGEIWVTARLWPPSSWV
ncbi:BQ5605_C010g05930 [Microbotryum silenes-dioicae]|uniref:BQ5605_C010g05930 protein n=1 Tax=Microbotryum silenes-dioicae TaxID=796604 RepID=A0A2X0LQ20_9BASI|nr:BQ5605_C010g05930 [Microbotryum silenes-dioicae]